MTSQDSLSIPLIDVPPSLLDEMRERLWMHTAAVFAVEDAARPAYRGTATCIAAQGREYLLTAAHVWRSVQRGDRFALSLEADRFLLPITTRIVEATVVGSATSGEWGPDLALIRLPDLVARDIRQVKAFYNVDKRQPRLNDSPEHERGLWAVLGAPEEQSTFGPREAVLKISLFASVVKRVEERDGFDYVDLSYFHEGRTDLPTSYGGLSGSGLWYLPISRSPRAVIAWNGEVMLEGVAFYQRPLSAHEGVLRSHGRLSLYGRLLSARR